MQQRLSATEWQLPLRLEFVFLNAEFEVLEILSPAGTYVRIRHSGLTTPAPRYWVQSKQAQKQNDLTSVESIDCWTFIFT